MGNLKHLGKKLVSLALVCAMLLPTSVPAVHAADKWEGLATGDVLIKDTITQIADGVKEHKVVTNVSAGNKQKIDYLCEIEPSDTIQVVSGYGENDASKWSLTTTSKQAKAYEADNPGKTVVAAINADFFNMATGEPLGALVMEGEVKHNADGRSYFGITKDGKAVIRNSADLSDLQSAVGGDAVLIKDGEINSADTAYGSITYSRTAIGIKEDGTIVTFVTHGNRAPISCGRTYQDIAEMLKGAGCVDALALDGGGSATFLARPEGTTGLQLRNSPVDGAERAVSSSLLVVASGEATGEFSHAQITPNNEVYTPNSKVQFDANGVDTAGFEMELPAGVEYTLADESKSLGSIDAATGEFTANDNVGVVKVQLTYNGKVVGETSIEIVHPDKIYFDTEEVSLGFEETSDLGIVVKSEGRDVHYKDGDIVWTLSDPNLGVFNGNMFTSSDGNSLNGTATATSAYDENVKGEITVIVGKLPTIVWDFEDKVAEDGTVTPGEDYYVGTAETPGILSTSNYGRGGQQSIEVVSIDDNEPVRFGEKSLKLNYDFTQCGEVTEGACLGTTTGMQIPGVPTGIGVWVYAPEGVGITWEGTGSQAGFWLRGYVKDGSGANVPYDFTLEPKAVTGDQQPGIYWEGWKYLEADLTKLQAPFSIQPGMTFRLMYVFGTQMGTRTANSIYFDNLQFVYGTNVDDIDNPVIDTITVDGKELEDGTVFNTNTVSIDSMFHDVQNKYTTGIDHKTVRMYIDGVNVVDNDRYQYAYDQSGLMTHLYDVKLKDGTHSVTISVRDGFGNETVETRYFVIDTDNEVESTKVKVVPREENALLGGTVNLDIQASDTSVLNSKTSIKLGNQFKEYEVIFADDYEGTYSYNKMDKTITITADKKEAAVVSDEKIIATLAVKVPANLLKEDQFSYTVKSGEFTTATDEYDTYSTNENKMDIAAKYNVKADVIIVGNENGTLTVTDSEGKAAANVSVYNVEDDSLVGVTDENGKIVTDQYSSTAAQYAVYAKDESGMLSFQYKFNSYNAEGDANGAAHNIRFNAVEDSATEKNITWMSNPTAAGKQVIKYAVEGSEEWTTVEAKTTQTEFTYNGNSTVNINAVKLGNLKPDTTYKYVVGTEDYMSEEKTFETAETNETEHEFFIIGDIQNPDKTNLQAIADIVNDEDYDFGVQIGDAVDQGNDYGDWSALGDILGEKMLGDTEMISVMGNHEYYGDADASIASAIYNNPTTEEGTCYSMEKGNMYMAVINFGANRDQIKAATEWLKKDAAASDATWKVLYTHQPAYYTNSVGGNDPVYDMLPDVCEEVGIDAVFSGHDHSVGRTNPLIDDQIDEENGILYYLCGATGGKTYPISTQDKFDYNTIFKMASIDYKATYLTVESDREEMTIRLYDLAGGLLDEYTLESTCGKEGHKEVYDAKTNEVKCSVCGDEEDDFTGEIKDKEGKEYYLISGVKQTEWVTVGEDVRYYGKSGIREEVVEERIEKTCIIDTQITYTAESGEVKKIVLQDAGGHEYVEENGKAICSVCGWHRLDMSDCEAKLAWTKSTYTGKEKVPATTVVNPETGDTLVKTGKWRDYNVTYSNNVEVGEAKVTLKAKKHGYYVNINDWRGSYKGSVVLTFTIHPDAPKNAKTYYEDGKDMLKWDAAKAAGEYVVYQSVDGGAWKEIGRTAKTKLTLKNIKENSKYRYRVYTVKADEAGKEYKSLSYASAEMLSVKLTVKRVLDTGKPVLTWNKYDGAKYTVYRATSANGKFTKLVSTTGTKINNTSAVAGTTYYYKVKATANGKTVTSDVVSATAICARVDAAVKNVLSTGKPKLTWDKVKYAKYYEVYASTSKNGTYKRVAKVEGTSYVHKEAVTSKTYYYKVRAVDKTGTRGAFNGILSGVCKLARPVVTITNNSKGYPRLTWKKVANADKYEVYRSTSKNGSYKRIVSTTKLSLTNTSTKKGQTYYYKVKAVDNSKSSATSAFSVVKSIKRK